MIVCLFVQMNKRVIHQAGDLARISLLVSSIFGKSAYLIFVISFTLNNVYFVKYDVTVSFLAQVLDTVTYFVPQVLDTAS